ncbi:exonuclease RecJ [Tistlia consotensis]|uniref:Single-stranded-DNA-specific exonuclease RecJ n=1 Tax=Tistlia consotensis USBA 355 TaxID=560819 RepID=A0A1Y6BQI9_9PROT|nr:single-stranded-DNA-specific exonuclease RecJ [Tistlia consotensis]SMF20553.1 exonuclease RecJ [Tistlia consotensis USBA 355]SNR47798.1 exonuclease RecJ [Tistlia consotensis]
MSAVLAAERPERRPCLLGVERSIAGKRWELRAGDERLALALAQRLGLPEPVGRCLAARGVGLDEAERFLAPTLRDWLPDPSRLKDMDRAAARIAAAVTAGETIALFGDYDVDGATSSALLGRFLRAVGGRVALYIPDRMKEGYGPNGPALRRLKAEGAGLALTLDCGITAHEPLAEAAEAGLEVIVVDHHAAEARLPPALAVVNPNRLDDDSGLGQLAAVGVAFLVAVAVNRALRAAGHYGPAGEGGERAEPKLLQWLDLVALGTVCDVVPLIGLNRAFVAQGLKVLAARGNVGLSALADVARLDETPGAYHCGFLLGPRVNAGGRVGEAGLGAELLSGDDPERARALAARLDQLNGERRDIEAAVLAEALAQLEAQPPEEGLALAVGEDWHPGVIGIVASRLKERFDRPALVVALDAEGVGKGSGRSVPGLDLGAAVIAARQAGLLINGGGHPMAAGLTVAAERLPELRAFLTERCGRELRRIGFQPALGFDAAIPLSGANAGLVRALDRLAPFGAGNAEPRFAVTEARVVKADPVGQGHLRCILADAEGRRLKAIAFREKAELLGPALTTTRGRGLHLAGKLRLDAWAGGDAVQLILEDAAEA